MNFRVDLILPSEQRSGSVLSLKSILRIVSIAIPSIILALFALGIISMLRLKSEYNLYLGEKSTTEPREKAAIKLRKEFGVNLDMLDDITGWQASHIDWHKQFLGLQLAVPEQIQFTALKVDQSLQILGDKPPNNLPARVFSCNADGKTRGDNPKQDVQQLKLQMQEQPQLAEFMNMEKAGVTITSFKKDPDKNAPKNSRVFTIKWAYNPLKFARKQQPK